MGLKGNGAGQRRVGTGQYNGEKTWWSLGGRRVRRFKRLDGLIVPDFLRRIVFFRSAGSYYKPGNIPSRKANSMQHDKGVSRLLCATNSKVRNLIAQIISSCGDFRKTQHSLINIIGFCM